MSADAKIWFDHETNGGQWEGIHDGPCDNPNTHGGSSYDLTNVLESIEHCMGQSLHWEFRSYPDGQIGLVGYIAKSSANTYQPTPQESEVLARISQLLDDAKYPDIFHVNRGDIETLEEYINHTGRLCVRGKHDGLMFQAVELLEA